MRGRSPGGLLAGAAAPEGRSLWAPGARLEPQATAPGPVKACQGRLAVPSSCSLDHLLPKLDSGAAMRQASGEQAPEGPPR